MNINEYKRMIDKALSQRTPSLLEQLIEATDSNQKKSLFKQHSKAWVEIVLQAQLVNPLAAEDLAWALNPLSGTGARDMDELVVNEHLFDQVELLYNEISDLELYRKMNGMIDVSQFNENDINQYFAALDQAHSIDPALSLILANLKARMPEKENRDVSNKAKKVKKACNGKVSKRTGLILRLQSSLFQGGRKKTEQRSKRMPAGKP